MDGQYRKIWLNIVLSGLKRNPNLIKISQKNTIKIMMKDIFLKSISGKLTLPSK